MLHLSFLDFYFYLKFEPQKLETQTLATRYYVFLSYYITYVSHCKFPLIQKQLCKFWLLVYFTNHLC